jgi:cob(I)alamin adenosyltransferase
MELNSYEIDSILYQKQMRLYQRIDDLINKQFDTLEADKLAVLTRTMKDLEGSIQLYKKELQNGELFGVTYHNNRKAKLESISLLEMCISI